MNPCRDSTLDAANYRAAEPEGLTELDRRHERFFVGMNAYFKRDSERAKLLSNLGLYFAGKGKPVRARMHYRSGLQALVRSGRAAGHPVVTCRTARYERGLRGR